MGYIDMNGVDKHRTEKEVDGKRYGGYGHSNSCVGFGPVTVVHRQTQAYGSEVPSNLCESCKGIIHFTNEVRSGGWVLD